jgi:hypothetical protein
VWAKISLPALSCFSHVFHSNEKLSTQERRK